MTELKKEMMIEKMKRAGHCGVGFFLPALGDVMAWSAVKSGAHLKHATTMRQTALLTCSVALVGALGYCAKRFTVDDSFFKMLNSDLKITDSKAGDDLILFLMINIIFSIAARALLARILNNELGVAFAAFGAASMQRRPVEDIENSSDELLGNPKNLSGDAGENKHADERKIPVEEKNPQVQPEKIIKIRRYSLLDKRNERERKGVFTDASKWVSSSNQKESHVALIDMRTPQAMSLAFQLLTLNEYGQINNRQIHEQQAIEVNNLCANYGSDPKLLSKIEALLPKIEQDNLLLGGQAEDQKLGQAQDQKLGPADLSAEEYYHLHAGSLQPKPESPIEIKRYSLIDQDNDQIRSTWRNAAGWVCWGDENYRHKVRVALIDMRHDPRITFAKEPLEFELMYLNKEGECEKTKICGEDAEEINQLTGEALIKKIEKCLPENISEENAERKSLMSL